MLKEIKNKYNNNKKQKQQLNMIDFCLNRILFDGIQFIFNIFVVVLRRIGLGEFKFKS